jgi:hypothetical protein
MGLKMGAQREKERGEKKEREKCYSIIFLPPLFLDHLLILGVIIFSYKWLLENLIACYGEERKGVSLHMFQNAIFILVM